MKRELATLVAGITLGGAGVALAGAGGMTAQKITLQDRDRVVMPELRWECLYVTRGPGALTGSPPGPELHCGRQGAWTGGIRTETDLYYVLVRRGTNATPQILFKGRRP